MNNYHPTDLRTRLLQHQISQLQGPLPLARSHRVAALQGLAEPLAIIDARQHDTGKIEVWPHA